MGKSDSSTLTLGLWYDRADQTEMTQPPLQEINQVHTACVLSFNRLEPRSRFRFASWSITELIQLTYNPMGSVMVVLSWTTLVVGLFSFFFLGRVSSNLKVRVLYIDTVQYFHYSYTPFSNISGGSTYLSHWIYQSFLTTLFPFFSAWTRTTYKVILLICLSLRDTVRFFFPPR